MRMALLGQNMQVKLNRFTYKRALKPLKKDAFEKVSASRINIMRDISFL